MSFSKVLLLLSLQAVLLLRSQCNDFLRYPADSTVPNRTLPYLNRTKK